ncbi:hypothetical protein BC940DRAFT_307457 [Gongronella butleri]|nr:hypothetical protein BC940DRAFT_307457 [Gongronella butleri]
MAKEKRERKSLGQQAKADVCDANARFLPKTKRPGFTGPPHKSIPYFFHSHKTLLW